MIAIDGSKFKAWNSKDRNYTKGKIQDRIRRAEEKITAYLEELEQADKETAAEDQIRTEAAVQALVKRRTELEGYLESITCREETQVSLTDPDSRLMKTKDGMSVCLNVQTAVDSKNKMVVEFAVYNQVQDKNLMSPMAEKASEILGVKSEFSKECDLSPVPLKKIRILQNKAISSQRKCIVEHPFGTVKHDMGVRQLLLRGIRKAEGELSLAFLAFNMKRALNIVGIKNLMAALG